MWLQFVLPCWGPDSVRDCPLRAAPNRGLKLGRTKSVKFASRAQFPCDATNQKKSASQSSSISLQPTKPQWMRWAHATRSEQRIVQYAVTTDFSAKVLSHCQLPLPWRESCLLMWRLRTWAAVIHKPPSHRGLENPRGSPPQWKSPPRPRILANGHRVANYCWLWPRQC